MPSFQFERRQGTRDSQLIVRAHFLRLIAELAPHVVDDLWPTFWQLVIAVCKDFGSDLIGGAAKKRSGIEVFEHLLDQSWHENKLFISNSDRANWRWRSLYWPFEEIHKLNRERVLEVFPSWQELRDSNLRENLQKWSEKWNMDSDWVREHAFVVMRRWLFNEGLQDSFLHPHKPGPNPFRDPPKAETLIWTNPTQPTPGKPNNWLTRIWESTALEALQGWENQYWSERWHTNVVSSRDILKMFVFRNSEPPRFILDDFDFDGWNFLDEPFGLYRKRVELTYRKHLLKLETSRLRAFDHRLALTGYKISNAEFATKLGWFNHRLDQLSEKLAKYEARMNRAKTTAIEQFQLKQAPKKSELFRHLKWTIQYQVPGPGLSTVTLASIAKRSRVWESAVSKAVNEILQLIGLEKRLVKRGGRKLGSKNSYATKILHGLGR